MSLPATGHAPAPHITIRPQTGWSSVPMREVWQFRDLLRTLAGRDLKVRYKQTALGVAWVVLQPLAAAGIFSFVFGQVADLTAPGGVPYFLFSFAGLIAWSVFATTLTRASGSMVGNEHLVSKVYFPRLILPLSTAGSALIDFVVALGMLAVLVLGAWHLPGAHLLLMPVCIAGLILLALGIGAWAAALAVSYRDVGHLVPVAVQFLLYASPVAYALQQVPVRYRTLYSLNPLVPLLETFRWSVLGVGEMRWGWLAYAIAASAVAFAGGSLAFMRMERRFADVI